MTEFMPMMIAGGAAGGALGEFGMSYLTSNHYALGAASSILGSSAIPLGFALLYRGQGGYIGSGFLSGFDLGGIVFFAVGGAIAAHGAMLAGINQGPLLGAGIGALAAATGSYWRQSILKGMYGVPSNAIPDLSTPKGYTPRS